MNTFQINLEKSISESPNVFGVNEEYHVIHLLIDGHDLIDMLKVFERGFAEREGSPSLAGNYSGLLAEDINPENFIGLDSKEYGEKENKVGLLGCSCGYDGCWPFAAKITVLDMSVVWSDFEQPHRTHDSAAGLWDYSSFGPFEFSREQYEKELQKILLFIQPNIADH